MSIPIGYKFGPRKSPPPFSEEHRNKLSFAKSGKMPKNVVAGWNKGKKLLPHQIRKNYAVSLETRRKLSESHKGIKPSNESNKKRSASLKLRIEKLGYHNSPEVRRKISEAKRGKPRLDIRGENCHFWKGGINPFTNSLRNCLEYKIWRTHCFQRDNYKCVLCGENGSGKLNVDHIMPFSMILQIYKIKTMDDAKSCEQLWDIRNGRTLCIPCHQKTDTFGNKKFNKAESRICSLIISK